MCSFFPCCNKIPKKSNSRKGLFRLTALVNCDSNRGGGRSLRSSDVCTYEAERDEMLVQFAFSLFSLGPTHSGCAPCSVKSFCKHPHEHMMIINPIMWQWKLVIIGQKNNLRSKNVLVGLLVWFSFIWYKSGALGQFGVKNVILPGKDYGAGNNLLPEAQLGKWSAATYPKSHMAAWLSLLPLLCPIPPTKTEERPALEIATAF